MMIELSRPPVPPCAIGTWPCTTGKLSVESFKAWLARGPAKIGGGANHDPARKTSLGLLHYSSTKLVVRSNVRLSVDALPPIFL